MSFTSERDQGFLFKIIVVGEQGVGKSALLLKYTKDEFRPDYNVTIGVEFASKTVRLSEESPPLTLQIWDTAGQESFKSIVRSFYKQAAAAFLIYNITQRNTFEALDEWLKEIRENAHEDIIIVLIGNHGDRQHKRQVEYQEGEEYSRRSNCELFFETSAKTGANVEKAFTEVSNLVFSKFIKDRSFRGSMFSEADDQFLDTVPVDANGKGQPPNNGARGTSSDAAANELIARAMGDRGFKHKNSFSLGQRNGAQNENAVASATRREGFDQQLPVNAVESKKKSRCC